MSTLVLPDKLNTAYSEKLLADLAGLEDVDVIDGSNVQMCGVLCAAILEDFLVRTREEGQLPELMISNEMASDLKTVCMMKDYLTEENENG